MPRKDVGIQRQGNGHRANKSQIDVRTQTEVLRALVAYGYAPPDGNELRQAIDQLRASLPNAGFAAAMEHDETVRQQLRDSFQHAVPSVWWVPREAVPLTVTAIHVAKPDARQAAYPVYGGDWRVVFWFTVAHVLQSTMHLLARCRGCGNRFVRTRRQVFCTTACGQRVRSRKWYAEHRDEAAERKHEAYVARRRRTHRNAKITRRPRLQQIATEVGTGGRKAPQVPRAVRKNARQSTTGKKRA